MTSPGAALLTGGTGAVGKAVTARFLADGYAVAVTYRSEPEWISLARAHRDATSAGKLIGILTDVTVEDSVQTAVDRAATALGGLRVLGHVAGGYAGGVEVERMDPLVLRGMIDLNLVSAFWAAKHVIPHAKRAGSGRLLFISSRGAIRHDPGAAAYAAAKAGLNALVGTLSRELKGSGVTANAILPSLVDTPTNRAAMPGADVSAWVQPESIASLLSYLASEEAAAVSGALIPIYGRA